MTYPNYGVLPEFRAIARFARISTVAVTMLLFVAGDSRGENHSAMTKSTTDVDPVAVADPVTLADLRARHEAVLSEVRNLPRFPLATGASDLWLSASSISARVSALAKRRYGSTPPPGNISGMPVLENLDPEQTGRWYEMEDGTFTYVFSVTLEGASWITLDLIGGSDDKDAFVIVYGGDPSDVQAPVSLSDVARGKPHVPVVLGDTFNLEIRNLKLRRTVAGNSSIGVKRVIYGGLLVERLRSSVVPAPTTALIPETQADCSYTDANCTTNASAIKAAVVKLLFGYSWGDVSSCTGTMLRDNDSSTDIPYVLTAGHCEDDGAFLRSVIFNYQSSSCNSSSGASSQAITPVLTRLDGEYTDVGSTACTNVRDWGLWRFNLLSAVSSTPAMLSPKLTRVTSANVRLVHHPNGEWKKYSEGTLSTDHGADYREFDMNSGYYAEGGSSGAAIVDTSDNTIIGVLDCAPGSCTAVINYKETEVYDFASRIGRFVNPRLATPAWYSNVQCPSTADEDVDFFCGFFATNSGTFTSTDGHIHLTFLTLAASGDQNRVSFDQGSSSFQNSFAKFAPGYDGLYKRDGSQDHSSCCVHVEMNDTSWAPSEQNWAYVKIRPKAAGALDIGYRATMQSENHYYYSLPISSTGGTQDPDQQWPLSIVSVNVRACPSLTLGVTPASAGSAATTTSVNCTTSTGKYRAGTTASIAASANTGYQFSSWNASNCTLANSGASSTTCTLTGAGNATVMASFAPLCRSLTPSVSPAAGGTATVTSSQNCGGGFTTGTAVAISASANPGYQFTSWSSGNCGLASSISTATTCTMTGAGNATVTANFSVVCSSLASGANPTSAGSASINTSQNCAGGYTSGTAVNISATANNGYQFSSWSSSNCTLANSSSASTTCTMTGGPATVTANFISITCTPVTASAFPSGRGSVSITTAQNCSGGYTTGTAVGISATANSGYQFSDWSASNCTVANATANPTTCTVTGVAAATIQANFISRCRTLTSAASPAAGGSAAITTPQNCSGGYTTGTAVGISAAPAAGYQFSNWSSSNCTLANSGAVSTTCTMSGAANASVTANFTFVGCNVLTPAASPTGGGMVSIGSPQNCAGGYTTGTTVPISASASVGYAFSTWVSTNCTLTNPSSSSTSCTMTGGSATVTANFSSGCTALIASATPAAGGTASVVTPQNCSGGYTTGTAVSISATAKSGYQFSGWSAVNCTLTNANASSTTCTISGSGAASVAASFIVSGLVVQQVSTFPVPLWNPIPAAFTQNGKVYYFGGQQPNADPYEAVTTIRSYDVASATWATSPPTLPYGMFDYNVSAQILNGTYVLGPGYATGDAGGWGSHKKVIAGSITSGAGVETATFPFWAMWNAGSCAANGKVYYFGGHDGANNDNIAEYDPATQTMTVVAQMLTTGNGVHAVLGSDGWIYYWRGWDPTSGWNKIERFHPSTKAVEARNTLLPYNDNVGPSHGIHVSSESAVYFFRGGENPKLYKYAYLADSLTDTGLVVPGNFTGATATRDANDERTVYVLAWAASITDPLKLMKITLPGGGGGGGTAPADLVATATSSSTVVLSWGSTNGATSYEVARANSPAGFATIANVGESSYTDRTVQGGMSYLYKVRAIVGGQPTAYSNLDVATTVLFSEDPVIVAVTPIRSVHVTQLRTAANALRAAAGLNSFAFTDAIAAGVAARSVHVTELRTAIAEARAAAGLSAGTFTTSPATGSLIRAVDINELRTAVK